MHLSSLALNHLTASHIIIFPYIWKSYATSRKVAGSSPDDVNFFNLPNPSSRTMTLVSTQHLTEISTRNLPGG
jgi:hypothetical protein